MSIVGQTAKIDIGVTQALGAYLAYGIDPGAFAMAMLRSDKAEAYAKAHPLLHDPEVLGNHGTEDVVATMLGVVESAIPAFARNDDIARWMGHKGLSGAPESIRTMTKLSIENDIIWNFVAQRYPEVIEVSGIPAPKQIA